MAVKEIIYIATETINDEFVIVCNVYVSNGSWVERNDIICEVETSKAVFEVRSPVPGYIEMKYREGQQVKVGECLACIHDDQSFMDDTKPRHEAEIIDKPENVKGISFSEKAMALINEHNLSENIFHDKRFVREKDVLEYLGVFHDEKERRKSQNTIIKQKIPSDVDVDQLSAIKISEINNLMHGQNMITSSFICKIKLPESFILVDKQSPFRSVKTNLTPLVLQNICKLLRVFKEFNAFYHENCIHFYNRINIGYVIDLNKGIKVVSIGDVGDKPLNEIHKTIIDSVRKYLQDKITVQQLLGSTFTVTDMSAENVFSFTPLINRFQSAILGICSIDTVDRSLLLNLVFDHRVTEGKKAAQFLTRLKKNIEINLHEKNLIFQVHFAEGVQVD